MIPFRFLHTADLHLDSRFAGLAHISPAIRAYLRESTLPPRAACPRCDPREC